MSNLSEVLGWKFNHEPGIRTRDGVLTAWPSSLGDEPTQAQIDQWTAEYEAGKTDADVDAEMDSFMDTPEMKSIIEGIADFAPGPPGGLRDAIKARASNNMPRGRK